MMKGIVKLHILHEDGRKEKFGLEVQTGAKIPLNVETIGVDTGCFLDVGPAVVRIAAADGTAPFKVGQDTGREFKIKAGSLFESDTFVIEFVSLPEPEPEPKVDEATRYVKLKKPEATPPPGPAVKAPETAPAARGQAIDKDTTDATEMILKMKVPERVTDEKPAAHRRREARPEIVGEPEKPRTDLNERQKNLLNLLLSFVIISAGAELACALTSSITRGKHSAYFGISTLVMLLFAGAVTALLHQLKDRTPWFGSRVAMFRTASYASTGASALVTIVFGVAFLVSSRQAAENETLAQAPTAQDAVTVVAVAPPAEQPVAVPAPQPEPPAPGYAVTQTAVNGVAIETVPPGPPATGALQAAAPILVSEPVPPGMAPPQAHAQVPVQAHAQVPVQAQAQVPPPAMAVAQGGLSRAPASDIGPGTIAEQQAAADPGPDMEKEEFFHAVKTGNLAVVRTLVESRAVDVNYTLLRGFSVLHYAALRGDVAMVRYLLSRRANLNAKDPNGNTPLMWAVFKNKSRVVKQLVKAGAALDIRRADGNRAVDIARRYDMTAYVAMLTPKEKNAKPAVAHKPAAGKAVRAPAKVNKAGASRSPAQAGSRRLPVKTKRQ